MLSAYAEAWMLQTTVCQSVSHSVQLFNAKMCSSHAKMRINATARPEASMLQTPVQSVVVQYEDVHFTRENASKSNPTCLQSVAWMGATLAL